MGTPRTTRLSRREIVETAVKVLDELGLDGLTVRRLAEELHVQNPSLYWHVRNKQELLDAVADALIVEGGFFPPASDEPWPMWLTRRARAYRASLLRHRDGARVVATARTLSVAVVNLLNRDLAVMVGFGFRPEPALHALSAVRSYVHGFVLQEQTQPEQRLALTADQLAALASVVDDGEEAPLVLAMRDSGAALSEAAFDFAIAAILNGVRTLQAR